MSQMELKRSAPSPSNETNPKRRAIPAPAEDSPLCQLFNDVAIQAMAERTEYFSRLCEIGKEFLISLQEHVNNCTKDSANIISATAHQIWEFQNSLVYACRYAIDKEPTFRDKLKLYANDKEPAERMNSMMKDPWLNYILGLEESDAFIRGFLCILVAYWITKDYFDKSKLATYTRPPPYITRADHKTEYLTYVINHVADFQNLKEVLESKYGSDPALADNLFEQISKHQLNGMYLDDFWKGKRAMIKIPLIIRGSSAPYPSKTFSFRTLRGDNTC